MIGIPLLSDTLTHACSGQQDHALTNGVDWVFPAGAKGAQLRFGSCYDNGDSSDQSWYAFPTVYQVRVRPWGGAWVPVSFSVCSCLGDIYLCIFM